MPAGTRLEIARKQIEFARHYTLGLIADLADDQWFTIPAGCVTHVGWQVGHLAMAQYGLCLFRMRGRKVADAELMSSAFRKRYLKGSTPAPEAGANAAPDELRTVLDRVHQQALEELTGYSDTMLDEPVDEPYAAFSTKFGALLFCSHHEMMHAGQIGLLRRLLGKSPLR